MSKLKKEFKKFILINPKHLGLKEDKTYVARETDKGYSMRVGHNEWIGFPKRIVELNPSVFVKSEYGHTESE